MSFNINFETNGEKTCTTATIRVSTGLPCELSNLLFTFEADHQYSTQLLVKYCQEQLGKTIQEFAKKCYELGWKDKSSKHRKRTEFTTRLNDSFLGW